ncbi:uncharacterized protein LOC129740483 [Uranotaenia lowii]|uniref:uncharacterized protein LOC129740483 n=1 Tax=Uranotaenia lowii TaxID=190385 RepID=UPI00247A7A62|nr:uncharacterized protein LOC129740483 [Uranotaenia lowii]
MGLPKASLKTFFFYWLVAVGLTAEQSTPSLINVGQLDPANLNASSISDLSDSISQAIFGSSKMAGTSKPEARDVESTYIRARNLLMRIQMVERVRINDTDLREQVMNAMQIAFKTPLKNTLGQAELFSKIVPCFSSLSDDIEKAVDAEKPTYDKCLKEAKYRILNCVQPAGARLKEEFISLNANIMSCINENKNSS